MVLFDNSTAAMRADHVPGPGQGNWTYKDYAALDDGKRYEILDGVLYMSPAPSWLHQEVVKQIIRHLLRFVEDAGLGKVSFAPLDVELFPDEVVQPDVLVILKENRHKIQESHIAGAPDLVVEASSPGTVRRDWREKYDAYARAGVKEYWIVDPIAEILTVLVLKDGAYHTLGIFCGEEKIHSAIVPQMEQLSAEQLFVAPDL